MPAERATDDSHPESKAIRLPGGGAVATAIFASLGSMLSKISPRWMVSPSTVDAARRRGNNRASLGAELAGRGNRQQRRKIKNKRLIAAGYSGSMKKHLPDDGGGKQAHHFYDSKVLLMP